MSYHLISNHGTWEVWTDDGNKCYMLCWFVHMLTAMNVIEDLKRGVHS